MKENELRDFDRKFVCHCSQENSHITRPVKRWVQNLISSGILIRPIGKHYQKIHTCTVGCSVCRASFNIALLFLKFSK